MGILKKRKVQVAILRLSIKIAALVHLPFKLQPASLKRQTEISLTKLLRKKQHPNVWGPVSVFKAFTLLSVRGRLFAAQQSVRLASSVNRFGPERANIEGIIYSSINAPGNWTAYSQSSFAISKGLEQLDFRQTRIGEVGCSISDLADLNLIPIREFFSDGNRAWKLVTKRQLANSGFDLVVLHKNPEKQQGETTEKYDEEISEISDLHRQIGLGGLGFSEGQKFKLWLPEALVSALNDWNRIKDSHENIPFEVVARSVKNDAGEPQSKIILLSRHLGEKFGGVEHFVELLAESYKELGFDVVPAGVQELQAKALTPQVLRDLVITQQIGYIHAFPGRFSFVKKAVEGLNVRVIFGIHHWREVLGDGDNDFFDKGGNPKIHSDFMNYLGFADLVYANSPFTAKTIEKAYGVRLPVLESATRSTSPSAGKSIGDHDVSPKILMPSLKLDKGAGFASKIASLLPDYQFTFVDSQRGNGVRELPTNCVVIPKVDNFADFIEGFDVVLIPSFDHVESYGRVAAECLQKSVPAIVADKGNLPNLAPSQLVLPPDANIWANTITRLTQDSNFRNEAIKVIKKLAKGVTTESILNRELGKFVSLMSKRPMLIGVGSGIGNYVHTLPAISSLGSHYCLDVVVNAEHPGSLFIAQNSSYTRYVFEKRKVLAGLPYQKVLLTHSWGVEELRIPQSVETTRDVLKFSPKNGVHEADFNIQSIRLSLQMDSKTLPMGDYFMGSLIASKSSDTFSKPKIGFHSGSKKGHWESKRWPYFDELAKSLSSDFEVISFGLSDEYVEGTQDSTGGDIEDMTAKITQCDFFVGNDSGTTHIAYALGIPTLFIFGPTAVPSRGPHPDLKTGSVEIPTNECYPCEITNPEKFQLGNCQCVKQISVNRVLKKILEMKEEHA